MNQQQNTLAHPTSQPLPQIAPVSLVEYSNSPTAIILAIAMLIKSLRRSSSR
ncbi:MAG TPA: hypothetical protein V6C78_14435 [Crinalium sp.]